MSTWSDFCTCKKAVRPLGLLYGINMGSGLVRIGHDRNCPLHGVCSSCGATERACYDRRWAAGFTKMLDPCCEKCSHLEQQQNTVTQG